MALDPPEVESLDISIRRSLLESANDADESFLPKDELHRILSGERILQDLSHSGALDRWFNITGSESDTDVERLKLLKELKARRQIYAILTLIEKTQEILGFIDEGIDDTYLPFDRRRGPQPRLQWRKHNGEHVLIGTVVSPRWSAAAIDHFHSQQWRICVPVFAPRQGQDQEPPHFSLHPRVALPFVEYVEIGKGAFGAVHRAKLHPSSHRFHHVGQYENNSSCFAIKEIRSSSEASSKKDFEEEVSNLVRFSPLNHERLISLLWTFSRGTTYYLVFPCARGNLMDLWRTVKLTHNHASAVWMAKQCYGISQGLAIIHHKFESDERHGRHGDLKPDNILWFDDMDTDEKSLHGTLKISDFGLTRFHKALSKSNVRVSGINCTPTQRAPEYDLWKTLSPKVDIWSLATVLLDFMTWYLQGFDAVDQFPRDRVEEDQRHIHMSPSGDVREDTYFDYFLMGRDQPAARLKTSVAVKFQTLYEHENCSDFTLDLLTFVEKRLMRMHPQRRAGCDEINIELGDILRKCESSTKYCLELQRQVPERRATHDSLLTSEPMGGLISESFGLDGRTSPQLLHNRSTSPELMFNRRNSIPPNSPKRVQRRKLESIEQSDLSGIMNDFEDAVSVGPGRLDETKNTSLAGPQVLPLMKHKVGISDQGEAHTGIPLITRSSQSCATESRQTDADEPTDARLTSNQGSKTQSVSLTILPPLSEKPTREREEPSGDETSVTINKGSHQTLPGSDIPKTQAAQDGNREKASLKRSRSRWSDGVRRIRNRFRSNLMSR